MEMSSLLNCLSSTLVFFRWGHSHSAWQSEASKIGRKFLNWLCLHLDPIVLVLIADGMIVMMVKLDCFCLSAPELEVN